MKEVYILATEQADALPLDSLRETFDSDDVELEIATDGTQFSLESDDARLEVRFETIPKAFGWTPDLITGSDEAHETLKKARGFYRIGFESKRPQASVAVFEALWLARSLMESVPGVLLDVTSFKLHDAEDVVEITELDFDIRDHVNLHAIEAIEGETPLWVHSHGMEKFGLRDVEIFHLAEADLPAAESFLHELCTDLAFGQSPPARTLIETSNGASFMLAPSEEARGSLMGVPLDTFEGHEGLFYTVVSPEGRHNVSELLRDYRGKFEQENEDTRRALQERAKRLLPAFKARFHRRGLMEPLTFLLRAPFETHPEGEVEVEHLWVEVVAWEENKIVGKLVDGAQHTTEWRKGAHVEVEEEQIEALALGHEGRTLEEEEMTRLLDAERPM